MAPDLVRFAIVNELYLLIGLGVGALVGLVDADRRTWSRVAAAYLLGLAVVGVLSTYLALLGVALGWVGLFLLTLLALAAGAARLVRASPNEVESRSTWSWPHRSIGLLLCAAAVVILVFAARTLAVKPLVEWDGWAQWALKAAVLYELPNEAATVLRDADYGHPTYPLVLPSLEAIAFRAMGHFDSGLADLQLLGLAVGLLGALWGLLRDTCSPALIGLSALAILTAPQFLSQLSWNYADVPLAIFVGAGLAACGRWLAGEPRELWPLVCAVAFLGAAGLTKNEGLLFSAAAAASLVAVSAFDDRRRLAAFAAAAAIGALVLPWRVYVAAYEIPTTDYDLSDALDPGFLADQADRVGPVIDELWGQLTNFGEFGFLVPAFAAALVAAFASRRYTLASFAVLWAALSFGGLVLTYWISIHPLGENLGSSSFRTVMSLLVGGAALVPVLLVDAPQALEDAVTRARRRRKTSTSGAVPAASSTSSAGSGARRNR